MGEPAQLERGLGLARSDVAEHDVHGGHRAVRGDSVRDSGDARTAEPGRVGGGSAAGGARWLHLGGAWRGDAAGRRKLRLSARSLRARPLGAVDLVPLYLADDFSGAFEHRVGRAGIRELFGVSDGEIEPCGGVPENVRRARSECNCRGGDTSDCFAALPADRANRENLRCVQRGGDRHDSVDHLGRRDAL